MITDRAAIYPIVLGELLGGPTTSYVLQSVAWCAGILLVFGPVAVQRYRRAV